ncbi:RNA polymerase sigma factor [Paenibacillus gorillae]|uniref:RNA polymerase sigma factor n=1 Tax=Paenibacillus gorillae TaxID=1243662 RepID=UPI0005A6A00E|nr:sigma factor-like helix-turn-helix DNA-binding protein [Paenibacillus gorillae]
MSEPQAIEQLSRYRQIQARIKVLSTYSVGSGITVSRLNQDDQLQELHRRLRGMPSYMYLSEKEQRLETVANAYLDRYPSGIKSQCAIIPQKGADKEDEQLLQELRSKIQKVIAARGYGVRDNLDKIIERVAELQDLQEEVERIDTILTALKSHKPEYAKILRMRHIDGMNYTDIAVQLNVTERTLRRWKDNAEDEYKKLSA